MYKYKECMVAQTQLKFKNMKYTIENQFENIAELKEAMSSNYCAKMQNITCFPINAKGRKILIGIDYNKNYENNSIHTVIADGTNMDGIGWSVKNNCTKQEFIKSCLKQVEQMLELIPEEDFNYSL